MDAFPLATSVRCGVHICATHLTAGHCRSNRHATGPPLRITALRNAPTNHRCFLSERGTGGSHLRTPATRIRRLLRPALRSMDELMATSTSSGSCRASCRKVLVGGGGPAVGRQPRAAENEEQPGNRHAPEALGERAH